MSAPLFADIVFPLAVDQAFTYAVPEALRERTRPGMRALAPMRNRIEAGYIVAVSQSTAVEKVRPLVDLPDA